MVLLAATPNEAPIRAATEKTRSKILTDSPKEEKDLIFHMRDVILKLASKLANCESVDELRAAEHLMEELIAGRIIIVDDATGKILEEQLNEQDGSGI
ncbi:hypothetical protein LX87_05202 [Larkinella arboricola]|uniref:Uncharacterized protein n=2 Tax=Larkinella arboricola TaxID=643671 RepID=A0A327WM80_LARAB|nr:hypothetical protein LX87_05202 [Larkinella arboricola]